jgi:coproporphyrinogen III oxidase-like Fe-S oxidoreductase
VARTIPIFAQKKAATVALAEFRVSPPLALYVHVPWCVQKCPYCDFNSHEAGETIPEREYVAALIADLQSALPLIWGRPVQTVFFGGGTPSLLSPAAIDELLAAFRALAMLAPDAEITLEANPGTVEAEKFRRFPRRRRQSPVARHPELQRRSPESARPHPRRRRSQARRATGR